VQDLVDKNAQSIYWTLAGLTVAALVLTFFANPSLPIGTSTSLQTVFAMLQGNGFGGGSKIFSLARAMQRHDETSW
jgi:hypothetical protein